MNEQRPTGHDWAAHSIVVRARDLGYHVLAYALSPLILAAFAYLVWSHERRIIWQQNNPSLPPTVAHDAWG